MSYVAQVKKMLPIAHTTAERLGMSVHDVVRATPAFTPPLLAAALVLLGPEPEPAPAPEPAKPTMPMGTNASLSVEEWLQQKQARQEALKPYQQRVALQAVPERVLWNLEEEQARTRDAKRREFEEAEKKRARRASARPKGEMRHRASWHIVRGLPIGQNLTGEHAPEGDAEEAVRLAREAKNLVNARMKRHREADLNRKYQVGKTHIHSY